MSHHRELVNPPELHPAPGFSHVAIATGTKVVHLAGQVALDQQFGLVGGDDLGEQTKAAMRTSRSRCALPERAGTTSFAGRSTPCIRPSSRRSRPRSTR